MQAPENAPTVINNAADAAALFAPSFHGAEGEKIVVAHLDRSARLIGLSDYPGTTDDAELPVREIFSDALRLGTSALIIAHNHPSGDPQPSQADCAATRTLADTGRSLGIAVHDHLIFAGGDIVSFRSLGLL